MELAPLVGLSNVIVDLVETGRTLEENGLVILDEICPISARMVVNRVSLKMENERITKVLKALRQALSKGCVKHEDNGIGRKLFRKHGRAI